jgi:hypothetical protein
MAKNSDPTKVALQITIEHSFGQWFHVHAKPVILGRTLAEMQAIDRNEPVPPVTHDEPRYISDYNGKIRGLRLDGLHISCQGNNSDEPRCTYAHKVGYQNLDIELFDYCAVESKIATLKTIQKRMDTLNSKIGSAVTYGQFVGRVAIAIGADCFVFTGKHGNQSITGMESGISRIDYIVKQWADKRDVINVA